jgi:hypothetical protein
MPTKATHLCAITYLIITYVTPLTLYPPLVHRSWSQTCFAKWNGGWWKMNSLQNLQNHWGKHIFTKHKWILMFLKINMQHEGTCNTYVVDTFKATMLALTKVRPKNNSNEGFTQNWHRLFQTPFTWHVALWNICIRPSLGNKMITIFS